MNALALTYCQHACELQQDEASIEVVHGPQGRETRAYGNLKRRPYLILLEELKTSVVRTAKLHEMSVLLGATGVENVLPQRRMKEQHMHDPAAVAFV